MGNQNLNLPLPLCEWLYDFRRRRNKNQAGIMWLKTTSMFTYYKPDKRRKKKRTDNDDDDEDEGTKIPNSIPCPLICSLLRGRSSTYYDVYHASSSIYSYMCARGSPHFQALIYYIFHFNIQTYTHFLCAFEAHAEMMGPPSIPCIIITVWMAMAEARLHYGSRAIMLMLRIHPTIFVRWMDGNVWSFSILLVDAVALAIGFDMLCACIHQRNTGPNGDRFVLKRILT